MQLSQKDTLSEQLMEKSQDNQEINQSRKSINQSEEQL